MATTSTKTRRTRILIISDTHCAPLKAHVGDGMPKRPFSLPLPKADLLIHCGDLTRTGRYEEYEQTLDMLKQIEAPVRLVIAGNHDLTLDRDFVLGHKGKEWHMDQFLNMDEAGANATVKEARDLWTAADGRAKSEGVTYLDEGLHDIDLPNGASIRVYATPYTPEFCDWGFPYKLDEDRFNAVGTSLKDATNIASNPVPGYASGGRPIDILLTHGPPYQQLDETKTGHLAGCPHLLRALMRSRPLLHCFGHIHEGWGARLVDWSAQADGVVVDAASIAECKQGGFKSGVSKVDDLRADLAEARENHAVRLDLSRTGRALERGSQTALVNAAIMDVEYAAVNAPWLIDIDLPMRVNT
ncbi:hypothetical protein EJ03DRAFT_278861 [Teratosphaeria nubilosa]|uniref:Calcineurin-like phosphoesterase domain-containing protein n=1 Tax=Teratosphaeria nubilosa TaxID=161662 RepID=A0A6G1L0V3_9PEZI|nr:hypothetical protein EJ03DRAFT_278861 [Teratosphaeria nubilosa]